MKKIAFVILLVLLLLLTACGSGSGVSSSGIADAEPQSEETNYIEGSWHFYGFSLNDTNIKAESSQRGDVTLVVEGDKVKMHYIDEDLDGTWELKNQDTEKVEYIINVGDKSYKANYMLADDHINIAITDKPSEQLVIYLVRD